MHDQFDRALPSSPDSEKSIIGSILLNPEIVTQVIGVLNTTDFYHPFYRRLFAAMLHLFATSQTINPVTLGEQLRNGGELESNGGVTAITQLSFGLPVFGDISEYIEIVLEKSNARKLAHTCSIVTKEVLKQEESLEEILDAHEQAIYQIRNRDRRQDFTSVADEAPKSANIIIDRARSGDTTPLGLPTGFKDLDEMTAGMQKGDLYILAGRPGLGKTSFGLMGVLNTTAYDPSKIVAYFSLEMTTDQLVNRLICQEGRLDATRYRKGHLVSKEWESVSYAVQTLGNRQIHIDDSARLSVMEIKARARKLRSEKKGLDLIVVDHLGLVKGSGRKEKVIEIGEITKALKAMAKDLDIPVLALCQLSRGPEKRPDNRPMMADLRASGEIEEDADAVWLLFREDYYKETEENAGIAELIVAKNRNGATGTIRLCFAKTMMRFDDLYQR